MGKSDFIGGRGESIASMRLDRIWRTDAERLGLSSLELQRDDQAEVAKPSLIGNSSMSGIESRYPNPGLHDHPLVGQIRSSGI